MQGPTPWLRRLALAGLLCTGAAWAQEPPPGDRSPPPHARRDGDRGDMQKWLRENRPEAAKRLAELRESDPEAAKREMMALAREYREANPTADGDRPGPPGDRRSPDDADHGRDFGRILERLRESDPDRYEALSKLRDEDPQAFKRTMQEWFRENYPEYRRQVFGAEEQSQDVARRYHDADAAGKAAMEEALRSAVESAFDERLTIQQQRVTQMEEQLAKLKAHLAERAEKKQEIVDARLAELKANRPAEARGPAGGGAERPPREQDRR